MSEFPESRLDELVKKSRVKLSRREDNFGIWKHANYWIGGASSVIAAVVGVSILADWLSPEANGALAIAAAVLTALIGFYDFGSRTVRVGVERAEWRRLHQRARSLQERWPGFSEENRLESLDALWERFCDLERADAEARAPDRQKT